MIEYCELLQCVADLEMQALSIEIVLIEIPGFCVELQLNPVTYEFNITPEEIAIRFYNSVAIIGEIPRLPRATIASFPLCIDSVTYYSNLPLIY